MNNSSYKRKVNYVYLTKAHGIVAVVFGASTNADLAATEQEVDTIIAKVGELDNSIIMQFDGDNHQETSELASRFEAQIGRRPMPHPFYREEYERYCRDRKLSDSAENRVLFGRFHQNQTLILKEMDAKEAGEMAAWLAARSGSRLKR